jgi:hypothetical protein
MRRGEYGGRGGWASRREEREPSPERPKVRRGQYVVTLGHASYSLSVSCIFQKSEAELAKIDEKIAAIRKKNEELLKRQKVGMARWSSHGTHCLGCAVTCKARAFVFAGD